MSRRLIGARIAAYEDGRRQRNDAFAATKGTLSNGLYRVWLSGRSGRFRRVRRLEQMELPL